MSEPNTWWGGQVLLADKALARIDYLKVSGTAVSLEGLQKVEVGGGAIAVWYNDGSMIYGSDWAIEMKPGAADAIEVVR